MAKRKLSLRNDIKNSRKIVTHIMTIWLLPEFFDNIFLKIFISHFLFQNDGVKMSSTV